jgi:hypothetical protein
MLEVVDSSKKVGMYVPECTASLVMYVVTFREPQSGIS